MNPQSITGYPKNLYGERLQSWLLDQLGKRDRIDLQELRKDLRASKALGRLVATGRVRLDNRKIRYPYIGVTVRNQL